MRSFTLVFLASLAASAALADDKPAAPSGDLAKLQGTWSASVGPNNDVPVTLEIKGNAVDVKGSYKGNDFEVKGEIALNEKASPRTLDWVKFNSPQGDAIPDNLAIYKLEGDSLTVCSGGPGNDRPTEFKKGNEGPPNLVTFKRVKDTSKPDAARGDLAQLEGSWESKDRPIVVEFKGNSVVARIKNDAGDESTFKGEATVNEAATPKTIDFVKFKGDNGDELGDNLGLYKFDGESLVVCVGGPGNPRPTEFKANAADGVHLWTFVRKK